jgi:NADP-dependent 3-hydroxy acid dehydrogenase YdfG
MSSTPQPLCYKTIAAPLILFKIIPSLLAQKSGHIVNLGSIAGRWVYSKAAVYCATKFAVRAFGEGLRQDLLGTSIRITTIEPGVVRTNLLGKYLEDKEKAQSFYSTLKPLEASDIAETILWTINRPAHVNIQEIVIYPTDQASATVFNQK